MNDLFNVTDKLDGFFENFRNSFENLYDRVHGVSTDIGQLISTINAVNNKFVEMEKALEELYNDMNMIKGFLILGFVLLVVNVIMNIVILRKLKSLKEKE